MLWSLGKNINKGMKWELAWNMGVMTLSILYTDSTIYAKNFILCSKKLKCFTWSSPSFLDVGETMLKDPLM